MPPSSLYCCQASVSRISAAARNRRIAASPGVRPPLCALAKATGVLANTPLPMAAAPPNASPVRKKVRRLLALDCLVGLVGLVGGLVGAADCPVCLVR